MRFLSNLASRTRRRSSAAGFTLVELLVAISIIGILASLLIANMVGLRERGSDAKLKNDLRQLKTALRLYYNDNQSYPSTAAFNSLVSSGSFEDGGTVYMKTLPDDVSYESPVSGGTSDTFLISVELSNAGDEDICLSAARCDQSCTAGTSTTYYECAD